MKSKFPVYDICTLSDFKQEDILISRFAPYIAAHKNLHRAHTHSFYHLVLFTQGAGSHAIDFQSFKVKPYQVYFMVPGQVHSWSFEGHVDGYVINSSVPVFQSFLLKAEYLEQFPFLGGIAADGVIDIVPEQQPQIKQLFEQLIRESETSQRLGFDMVRVLLLQFFISMGRLSMQKQDTAVTPYNYTLLRNFQKLIESNFINLKLPKDYARLLYITPNHLNALCNSVLGVSAGELIRSRIMLEAKRLLVSSSNSIAEIAYQLNFTDNSYFTKFFKKQSGFTPEEFKKDTLKQAII